MHVIFLVHGMGSHEADKWAEGVEDTFKEFYDPKRYAFLEAYPMKGNIEFCPINYNDIFDEYLEEARKQADKIADWSKLAHPIEVEELDVLKYLLGMAGAKPSNKFAITHLADVALYVATDLGHFVNSSISRQIRDRLLPEKFNPTRESWSVVAHSLGTRVTTEVLQAGFTEKPGLRHLGKARVVMMIANTSHLIEKYSPYKTGDVYKNAVYPAEDPAFGVCRYYINAAHDLDPVASIRRFNPTPTFGNGRTAGLYHSIRLEMADITSKNIHDAEHYLRHPKVHANLFRFLVSDAPEDQATEDEMKKALEEYRKETLLAPITDVWRNSVDELRNRSTQTLADIMKVWEAFGALIS
jgi:hypothetical protein